LPISRAADIAEAARSIRDTERVQAARMANGRTLRSQAKFTEFLAARDADGRTFREHLRSLGGAIEE
jgi:hypothetical protein